MTGAVDVHAHVLVPELLRDAAPDESWRPAITRRGARQVVELNGRATPSIRHEFVMLDEIVAARERIGIGHVLLCPWIALLFYDLEPAEGLRRARLQNSGLARLREQRPDRVSVLGTVPLQDPQLAADELEALMSAGTFAGVEVATSVAGTYLGDPRFEPFWDAAERTGALVFVHPTTRGFEQPVFQEYYLHNLVGNPTETTIAGAHMVLAGVLERHPSLKVLLAHGGGTLVALRGRLRRGQQAVAAADAGAVQPADDAIGRFLFDTVTHDPGALRALIDAVGADRVMLGSDYPFDMADPDPIATVRAAGLAPEAEEAVLRGNAQRLLGRERVPVR